VPAVTDQDAVSDVIDGDTLLLRSGVKARLVGINAPQAEFDAHECGGDAAKRDVRRLLPAQTPVRYIRGGGGTDGFGRALVYVWLRDGRFVNQVILERGDAKPVVGALSDSYARAHDLRTLFAAAAVHAASKDAGLWHGCA
jgi:micrococcal nuclease